MPDEDELRDRFQLHPANTDRKAAAHERVRNACGALAQNLNDLLPEGREKSLAMTKLEEVMFWSNAGLARHMGQRTNS